MKKSIHEICTKHEITTLGITDLKNVMFGINGNKGLKDRIINIEWQVKGLLIMNGGIIGLLVKLIFFSIEIYKNIFNY